MKIKIKDIPLALETEIGPVDITIHDLPLTAEGTEVVRFCHAAAVSRMAANNVPLIDEKISALYRDRESLMRALIFDGVTLPSVDDKVQVDKRVIDALRNHPDVMVID